MTLPAPRFTITNAITTNLTAIERARGFLEAATLSEAWVQRMSQRALLLEAHHTTHIEGTQLTIEQAEQVWSGKTVTADGDDVRELLNYRAAFQLVSDSLNHGDPITEGLIREIHKRLVEGVRGESGQPGRYRTVQNFVANSATKAIVYTPPAPQEVPPLMHDLVTWLREDSAIHPVLVAGIAQFLLVHIHPFVDGNGRTSRLLSTLCLYRSGYDFKRLFTISEFYDRDRSRFYRAIQGVRDAGMDLTGWLEFFSDGLATQLNEIKDRGVIAIRTDVVAREHGLNPRQTEVLDLLVSQGRQSMEQVAGTFPTVNRRTLQRDVKVLIDKGLAREIGSSPTDPNRLYEAVTSSDTKL